MNESKIVATKRLQSEGPCGTKHPCTEKKSVSICEGNLGNRHWRLASLSKLDFSVFFQLVVPKPSLTVDEIDYETSC